MFWLSLVIYHSDTHLLIHILPLARTTSHRRAKMRRFFVSLSCRHETRTVRPVTRLTCLTLKIHQRTQSGGWQRRQRRVCVTIIRGETPHKRTSLPADFPGSPSVQGCTVTAWHNLGPVYSWHQHANRMIWSQLAPRLTELTADTTES